MVANELRPLKLLAIAATTFSFICLCLNGAILSKGLKGEFSSDATTKIVTEIVTGELRGSSPTVKSGEQPVPTEGACLIDVRPQAEGEIISNVPDWHPDDNVIVTLAGDDCDVGVSPTWTIAEWDYTVVQIAPNAAFTPPALGDDERQLVKIIKGTLMDVNFNGLLKDGHWETYTVTVPNRAVPLFIDSAVDTITAGADGAVIVYMKVTEETLNTPLTDMHSAPANVIAGPYSENFKWVQFGTIYPDPFEGIEFWNIGQLNVRNNDGSWLNNMQWWTFREDFDADGYHNMHAFGEVHMVTHTPSAMTGMQTTLPDTENLNFIPNPDDIPPEDFHKYNMNDQTGVQMAVPLAPGSAHGPLWSVDPNTGGPTYRCDGTTFQYPMHRMIVNNVAGPSTPPRYVSWIAFEHPAENVIVPKKMLTEWPNAYLQTTMTPDECNASPDDETNDRNQPVPTDGACLVDVRLQAEGEVLSNVPDWHPDNNVIVTLAGDDCDVGVSPTWTMADWDYTVVQIAPNAVFTPPEVRDEERQLVKIIKGTLLDVNLNGVYNDGHWETYTVTVPNRAVPLFIDSSVDAFTAGADGAVIVYIKVTEKALMTPFTDMFSEPATIIGGPFSEVFQWVQFGTIYPDPFEGIEFWNIGQLNVRNNDGSWLHNMQWWTFREDFDADGYHDGHPFGEVHMITHTPNGMTGMQTTLPGTENLNFVPNPDEVPPEDFHKYNLNDQTEVQLAIPLSPGSAHGPLWSVDPSTGKPTYLCDGVHFQYPMHRMIVNANGKPNSPLRYVSWIAFEHPAENVVVPQKMLTEWPNAYLQSTMTPEDCAAMEQEDEISDANEEEAASEGDTSENSNELDESEKSENSTEQDETAESTTEDSDISEETMLSPFKI